MRKSISRSSSKKRSRGYCVRCKDKRTMTSPKEITMKNGRHAIKGSCEKCGTGMYTIISSS